MHYGVSGRAPSIISAALAILLAAGMHLFAPSQAHAQDGAAASPSPIELTMVKPFAEVPSLPGLTDLDVALRS